MPETVTLEIALRDSATPGLKKIDAAVDATAAKMAAAGRKAGTALAPVDAAMLASSKKAADWAAGTTTAAAKVDAALARSATAASRAAGDMSKQAAMVSWQVQDAAARAHPYFGAMVDGGKKADEAAGKFTNAAAGAKKLGYGIAGMFGGIAGIAGSLALAGLDWLINKLGEADRLAAQIATNRERATGALADSFAKTGGQITADTRDQAFKDLDAAKWGRDGWSAANGQSITALTATGVTLADMINARLGDPEAVKRTTDQITSAITEQQRAINGMVTVDKDDPLGLIYADGYQSAKSRLQQTQEMLAAYVSVVGTYRDAQLKFLNEAAGRNGVSRTFTGADIDHALARYGDMPAAMAALGQEAGIAADKVGDLNTKVQLAQMRAAADNPLSKMFAQIGNAAVSAAGQVSAFRSAVSLALGIDQSAEDVRAQFWAQVESLRTGAKDATTATGGNIESLIRPTGEFDVQSEAGRNLRSTFNTFLAAADAQILDAYRGAGGGDAGKAAARTAYELSQEQAVKIGADLEIDPAEWQAVIDRHFGVDGAKIPAIFDQATIEQGKQAIDAAMKAAGEDTTAQLTAGAQAFNAWAAANPAQMQALLDANPAYSALASFRAAASQPVYSTLQLTEVRRGSASNSENGGDSNIDVANAGRRAAGGPIVGPGTGTSDSVPFWGSNGEHVITDQEVRGAGGHGAVMAWRRAMRAGRLPAFRTGGPVGAVSMSAPTSLSVAAGAVQLTFTGRVDDPQAVGDAVEQALRRILAEQHERAH